MRLIAMVCGLMRQVTTMVAISAVVALGGCASNGVPPSCPEPENESPDYVIGAGDSLQIYIWRHDELTSTVPVRPDGKISIPLVEDMVSVGKTPTQLARDIEEQLSEYLRTPKVNIIVVTQGSANQIQVVGNVASPQSLPYREGIRVLDVIVAVGGLGDFAAGNRSKIVRQTGGLTTECRVRIVDLIEGGDLSQNAKLYPGDVIIVPQARF
jgi:polysaccharide export outer membrane protein